jgi:hypothetical protein
MATSTKAAPNGRVKKTPSTMAYQPVDASAATVQIERIAVEAIAVPIVGTSPLIVNRFSEKAKRQMLDAMQGKKTPKEPKNPEKEYEAARYRFEDGGDGFPVIAFKAATIDASRFYGKSVTKVGLRQFLFFKGDIGVDNQQLARINGTPEMREDVVRVGQGGTDLHYRPMFQEWSTTLHVVYVTSALTRDSVLALIDAGGLGVGVGEWRPEKSGDFGTFRIDMDKEIEVLETPS